jgi:ribosomal protein L29
MVSNRDLQINQHEDWQMSTVALASGYARRLVENEARRTGEPLKVALNPVARRVRAAPATIWSLLFRPPKRVSADLLAALEAAMEHELNAEIRALQNELAALRATAHRPNPRKIAEVEEGLARLRAVLRDEDAA